MGQTIGRAPQPQKCGKFLNLPKSVMYSLWSAYNDIAEGFGLTLEETAEICKAGCLEHLDITERLLIPDIDALFKLLDEDNNNLIDALEFLSALALYSGMTPEDKIRYIFLLYDFDETGILTLDEMVLAFRSSLLGACKLAKIEAPYEFDIENLVGLGFELLKTSSITSGATSTAVTATPANPGSVNSYNFYGIDREYFIVFCLNTPDIMSWVLYFDNTFDYFLKISDPKPLKNTYTNNFYDASTTFYNNYYFNSIDASNNSMNQSINPSNSLDSFRYNDDNVYDLNTLFNNPYYIPTLLDEAYLNPSRGGKNKIKLEENQKIINKKPWKNVISLLSSTLNNNYNMKRPTKNLILDWVYGFNSYNMKNNLIYTALGDILYPAGSLLILQNLELNSQKYFSYHSNNISSLTYYHTNLYDNTIVASAELGLTPTLLVWETRNLSLIQNVNVSVHKNGIQNLSFSSNKKLLVALGMDNYHTISIHQWKKNYLLYTIRTTNLKIYDLKFFYNNLVVICGENFLYYYKFNKNLQNLNFFSYSGQYKGININESNKDVQFFKLNKENTSNSDFAPGSNDSKKEFANTSLSVLHTTTYTCVNMINDIIFTCNTQGFIELWEGRNYIKKIKAHLGAIQVCSLISSYSFPSVPTSAAAAAATAANASNSGSTQTVTGFVTGCNLGKILIWNLGFEIISTFNINNLGPSSPIITSLYYNNFNSKILIGLKSSEIFLINSDDGHNALTTGAILSGSSHPFISSIACHPYQSHIFASISHDKTLKIYDIENKRLLRKIDLGNKPSFLNYSNNGQYLLVGLGSNNLLQKYHPNYKNALASYNFYNLLTYSSSNLLLNSSNHIKINNFTTESANYLTNYYENYGLDPKEGVFLLLNSEDLTLLYETKNSKEVLICGQFSPNNETFSIGSFDHNIYVYNTKKFNQISICRGHTSPIISIDYSSNGEYLMSNSVSGELFFWEVNSGTQMNPKNMKGIKWETNSSTFSFNTQGLYLNFNTNSLNSNVKNNDEKELNFVLKMSYKTHDDSLLLTISSYGSIILTNYPCILSSSSISNFLESIEIQAHSKGINTITGSCNDETILTGGETDGCIYQWKLIEQEGNLASTGISQDLKKSEGSSQSNSPSLLGTELIYHDKFLDRPPLYEGVLSLDVTPICNLEEIGLNVNSTNSNALVPSSSSSSTIGVGLPGGSTSSMNVGRPMLPWQKSLIAPTKPTIEDQTEPPDSLELDFIHGITTDITRKNIFYIYSVPNVDINYDNIDINDDDDLDEMKENYENYYKSSFNLKDNPNPNDNETKFAYFISNIVVIMSNISRKQIFYQEHHNKVTALSVNLIYPVIASAELSKFPKIHIWNYNNLKTLHILNGGNHTKAYKFLKFSRNGKLLCCLSSNVYQNLSIYDWKKEIIIYTTKTTNNLTYDLDFNPNNNYIIQTGQNFIKFWNFSNKNFYLQEAILTNRAKSNQGFLCIGWIGNSPIIGTADGNLYRFLNYRLESIVQAHTNLISNIASVNDGLATCSYDGYIKIWTRYLECRLVIDIKALHSISNNIKGIDWFEEKSSIIFTTAASEIFEISSADGENKHKNLLMEGHSGENLYGLSIHPLEDLYCTVGDDSLLKIWDINLKKAINTIGLEMPARCCAYSPDGKHIAIGFGSNKKLSERQFDGKWIIIDTEDYQISHEARDSMKWLREIKYSPNNKFIAISSEDNKIYIYSVSDGYPLNAIVTQHQSFIFAFDFSEDSQWIRSNCGGFELNYFEAETGLYIPAAARLRDVKWATQQCVLEYGVQGIWPPYSDGTDYIALDCNLSRGDDNGQIIVAGDNYGRIKLYRYPCLSSLSNYKLYWPSSNQITRLRFASGDSYVIALSGTDKAIFQYRHIRDRDENVAFQTNQRRSLKTSNSQAVTTSKSNLENDEEDEDYSGWILQFHPINPIDSIQEELAKLVTTRPWLGAIVPPSNYHDWERIFISPLYKSPLNCFVVLNHIFGLETKLLRNKICFYNANNDIIFPSSKYIINFNKNTNQQTFYSEHINEISCMAISSDGLYGASSEKSLRPRIHIWDCLSFNLITILPLVHRRGVLSMEFHKNNEYLVSLGADNDHSLALWYAPNKKWESAQLINWVKSDISPVTFCAFYDYSSHDHEFLFVSGGRSHIKFWKNNYNTLTPYYPEYNNQVVLNTLLCGTKLNKLFLSGSVSGHLYIWKGRKLDRIIRVHEKAVTSLKVVASSNKYYYKKYFNDGDFYASANANSSSLILSTAQTAAPTVSSGPTDLYVLTASKDCTIKLWTNEFEHLKTIDLLTCVDVPPLINSKIRSIDCQVSSNNGQILSVLVTTSNSEIYEVNLLTNKGNLIHESHFDGELWGLATHPTHPELFLTSSDDNTIRLWNIREKKVIRKAKIDCTSRTVCWSPDGKNIVVGLGGNSNGTRQRKDGAFLLLDGETLKPKFEGRDSRHWISEVSFSPTGKTFAIASMDHRLYLYQIEPLRLRGQGDLSNGPIISIDFTSDGSFIQGSSLISYEHLYFEGEDGQGCSQAQGQSLRDAEWSSWTCPFGWSVQGIWPRIDKELNATSSTNNAITLATLSNTTSATSTNTNTNSSTNFNESDNVSFLPFHDTNTKRPTCVCRSPDQKLIAVGDEEGMIKIYRYPCVHKDPPHISIKAHIGEISRIRFTCDNKNIITIGKKDRAIAIWKLYGLENLDNIKHDVLTIMN